MKLSRCLLALWVGMVGCGSTDGDAGLLISTVTDQLRGNETTPVTPDLQAIRDALTPEIIDQFDGPALLVSAPSRGAVALMPRVGVNKDVETFLTPDGISISLRDGFVVATRGFGFDLMVADFDIAVSRGTRIHWYLDGENQLIPKSFTCVFERTENGRAVEKCRSERISFVNSYAFSAGGELLQSEQWVSAEVGVIVIEILR